MRCTSEIRTIACSPEVRDFEWMPKLCGISLWPPAACSAARWEVRASIRLRRHCYSCRRCLSRRPNSQETNELLTFLHKETKRFEDGGLDAWDLAGTSPAISPLLPKGVTPAQLAGWVAVSRVLLNVDETITKE